MHSIGLFNGILVI